MEPLLKNSLSLLQQTVNQSTSYTDFLQIIAKTLSHTFSNETQNPSFTSILLNIIRDKILDKPHDEQPIEEKKDSSRDSNLPIKKRKITEINDSTEPQSNKKIKLASASPEVLFLLAVSSPRLYETYKLNPNSQEIFNDLDMNKTLKGKLIKFLRGEKTNFGIELLPALHLARKYQIGDLEVYCEKQIQELMSGCTKTNNFESIASTLNFLKFSDPKCPYLMSWFIKTMSLLLDNSLKDSKLPWGKTHFWSLVLSQLELPTPFLNGLIQILEIKSKDEGSEGENFLRSILRLRQANIKLACSLENPYIISIFNDSVPDLRHNLRTIYQFPLEYTLVDSTEKEEDDIEEKDRSKEFQSKLLNVIIGATTSFEFRIEDLDTLFLKLNCTSLSFIGETDECKLEMTPQVAKWTQKMMPKLDVLNLMNCKVTDEMIDSFKVENSKLNILTISGSSFTSGQMVKLFDCLKDHPKLGKFTFSKISFEKTVDNFTSAMQTNFKNFINECTPIILNFDESPVMTNVLDTLLSNEKTMKSITHLSLNKIGDLNPYADKLSKALNNENLGYLNIGSVQLDSTNVQKIVKAASFLEGLDLSGIPLDPQCAWEIGVLCEKTEFLTELCLKRTGLKGLSLDTILNGIGENKLGELDLSENPFGEDEFTSLQSFLSTTDSDEEFPIVEILNVQNIPMSWDDLNDFNRTIEKNDKLEALKVSIPSSNGTPLKSLESYKKDLDPRIEIIS